jgi:uncharacterized protein YkvS
MQNKFKRRRYFGCGTFIGFKTGTSGIVEDAIEMSVTHEYTYTSLGRDPIK